MPSYAQDPDHLERHREVEPALGWLDAPGLTEQTVARAGSPPPSALAGTQGGAGLRRGVPGRCARQCSDQGCAFIANAEQPSQAGSADGYGQRPVPVPGDRGLGFLHAARERRPLDELPGLPLTALRSVRCMPAGSSPRSRATPDAGLLMISVVLIRIRPPRQSLRLKARRSRRRQTSMLGGTSASGSVPRRCPPQGGRQVRRIAVRSCQRGGAPGRRRS